MSDTAYSQAVALVVEGAFDGEVNPDQYASMMVAAAVQILVRRHGYQRAFDVIANVYDVLAIQAAKGR